MRNNVGTFDRVFRIALGLALLAMVFIGPQTSWGWLGIVPLATALIGWCPLYAVFGVSTCGTRRQAH